MSLFKSRTLLRDVMLLATPMSVMIDPANGCNFRCVFCPTANPDLLASVGRPIGVMKYPLFTKIIDDMTAFERPVQSLLLYKDGEPLVNRRLADMVRYAKKKGVADEISITTNAALLSRERAVELIEAELDNLRVSVEHVHDEGYRKITQTFDDYQAIIANVTALFEEKNRRGSPLKVHAKIVNVALTPEELLTFKSDFEPISDSVTVETLMGWSNTEDMDCLLGTEPTTGVDGHTGLKTDRKVCPSPFKTLAVNFDGRVSLCCVDWSMGTVVGDAAKEHLVDIWNGEALRQFRLTHLKGQRDSIPACNGCQYIQGMSAESDLDDIADDLIAQLSLSGVLSSKRSAE